MYSVRLSENMPASVAKFSWFGFRPSHARLTGWLRLSAARLAQCRNASAAVIQNVLGNASVCRQICESSVHVYCQLAVVIANS